MNWIIQVTDKLINDLEEEDEEIQAQVRAEFNHVRDEAVRQVNAARRQMREQRGVA